MSTTEDLQPLNTPESLEIARGYAGLLGEIPSSYTGAVRSLILDEEKGSGVFSTSGKYALGRLLKSPMLATSFNFVIDTAVLRQEGQNTSDMMTVFSPLDSAGIVSMFFVYRKIKSIASKELWEELQGSTALDSAIGAVVGRAIPKIGLSFGLAVGLLPRVTLCLFEKQDVKAFKEYRRHLRSTKLPWDLQYEMRTWGCTRFNIGSIFLQIFGFGVQVSNAYSTGLSDTSDGATLSPLEYRFRIAQMWLQSVRDKGGEPAIRHRGEYYPSKGSAEFLYKRSLNVKEGTLGIPFFFDVMKEVTAPVDESPA